MDEGAWSFNEAKALNYFYMVGCNAFIWWSDTAISLQAFYKAMGRGRFQLSGAGTAAIWSVQIGRFRANCSGGVWRGRCCVLPCF